MASATEQFCSYLSFLMDVRHHLSSGDVQFIIVGKLQLVETNAYHRTNLHVQRFLLWEKRRRREEKGGGGVRREERKGKVEERGGGEEGTANFLQVLKRGMILQLRCESCNVWPLCSPSFSSPQRGLLSLSSLTARAERLLTSDWDTSQEIQQTTITTTVTNFSTKKLETKTNKQTNKNKHFISPFCVAKDTRFVVHHRVHKSLRPSGR